MKKQISTISLLVVVLNIYSQSAVTYALSGGRFGDNILAYTHAKWVAFKHNIPLVYTPFKYGDQLRASTILSPNTPTTFEKTVVLKRETEIDPKKNILYVVPYFSEDRTEFKTNPHWIHFKTDWNNSAFKKQLIHDIAPLDTTHINNLELPTDRTTVAVHIRLGGGVDSALLSNRSHYNAKKIYANLAFPLKFPPLDFYIKQIKRISALLDHTNLYVYIFTDDRKPARIVNKIKKHFKNYNNILFACRKRGNAHNKNVLDDFFALTHFDYLIRPQSNFSFTAARISDFIIEIFPTDYYINNHVPSINKVGIINKNSLSNHKKIEQKKINSTD